jgi:alpha-glucosidase (family GH31 glycosyl hydrolase)
MDLTLTNGNILRVEAINDAIFRVRLSATGDFPEPGLVRYGIVRSDWPEVTLEVEEAAGETLIQTAEATLAVNRRDGRVRLLSADGDVLVEQCRPPIASPGFDVRFGLGEGEQLYGHGDETRERLDKRGHQGLMMVRNVVSYTPIPFLMSTGGWAVFVNSTWFHQFDAGATDPDELRVWADEGELDIYLIAGESLPVLLDRYTQLTGRPHLLPLFGYGLTFVCDDRGVRARDVLYEGHTFRREEMPCDIIGLEPNWMETHYDFSLDKKWSEERFHFPFWLPGQKPGGFPAALGHMGFKLSLWLCCDYDVTEYEEMQLRTATARGLEARGPTNDTPTASDDDLIQDPHFQNDRRFFDAQHRAGEGWFEHLKKFVDDGAQCFKMDGANQVLFHPDRKWRNGMDDAEMHNLYPLLLAKQMSRGYGEYTGRRAMIYTACGYAGTQQYAATWAGDTGGGEKPLVSLLNHGLSGHSNTSCDMQIWNAEGIHFGFLQPWCQILSWHQYNQPFFLGQDIEPIFRFYLDWRYRHLPYFYSAAHVAARTGLPIMRAMPLVAPDDPASPDLMYQYMVGEWFLTAAFTDTIHLPPGRWIDYWTGQRHTGPKDLECSYPAGRGGPLFVPEGAIIPTYPLRQYVGEGSVERVGLEVFPSKESSFTLYEDDGISYAYLDGAVATTEIICRKIEKEIVLRIGPRQGTYEGMPEQRHFDVRLHLPRTPAEVTVNKKPLAAGETGWQWDPEAKMLTLTVSELRSRKRPVTVTISG